MDVLSASENYDKIAWYENKTIHLIAVFPSQASLSDTADGEILVGGKFKNIGGQYLKVIVKKLVGLDA